MGIGLNLNKFPFYKQLDAMDCGPTCLRMVTQYYGKSYSLQSLREKCYINREGVSLKAISEAAEKIGFHSLVVKIPFSQKPPKPSLLNAPLPAIAHWNQNHFVVITKVTNKYVWIADPAAGIMKLKHSFFEQHWSHGDASGFVLLLEPGREFYEQEGKLEEKKRWSYLYKYLKPFRKLMLQLVLGLLVSSVFTIFFPFLTQAIVDVGIQNQDVNFIKLILIGQLILFSSQTLVRFLQNWILLHIGVRLNVSLISDFLAKMMKLPLGFFDSKMTGDLLQRISDHKRIESFLTQSTLSIIFSVFNLIVFSIILLYYSSTIFLIFLTASILYISWISIFLKKRKEIDYQAFQQMSDNQDALIEIIHGMPEIKLQGSHLKRRWRWAEIQARLFHVRINALAISQYQDGGALFINQLKDILITIIAAMSVVEGEITIGMMLSIQYIIGQVNAPLQQLIGFIRTAQDAQISLDRLQEIHQESNEEAKQMINAPQIPNGDISLQQISFRYTPSSDWVLDNLSLTIPRGKVTAIVGLSGSGKTTLIKLLLGFYQAQKGKIKVGNTNLQHIQQMTWRKQCGAVLQDGYIFSDTIANNISESDDFPNYDKIQHAVDVANIGDFIESLPRAYNTLIGARGNGISQGQRQRILIARAVYKDPEFLFFDEATNALDANNESIIINKLEKFFQGRTVIVVAHRLSTVKNADTIVVLDKGKIVEQGSHHELTAKRGKYYTLVKNQLELGNA